MWYVIQVGAGKEARAEKLIRRFVPVDVAREVFSPKYEVMRKYHGEWCKRTETLLPGYLFVRTADAGELCECLRSVPAFTRLLGTDGVFTPIDDSEMSFIEAFTEKHTRVVRMSTGVVEGDKILVLKGPLMGQTGLIKKIDRHKRIAYLGISILGRQKTVKVGLEIVRKHPEGAEGAQVSI